jgi:hypothetical protein
MTGLKTERRRTVLDKRDFILKRMKSIQMKYEYGGEVKEKSGTGS